LVFRQACCDQLLRASAKFVALIFGIFRGQDRRSVTDYYFAGVNRPITFAHQALGSGE
jgi:hypothetical protein